MNKVYKVIWSKVKNCYVVASELAKNHTKAPASKVLSKTIIAGILASVISCGAVMPVYASYGAGAGNASGNNAVAIGNGYSDTYARGDQTVAVGGHSTAANIDDVAFGFNAQANSN